MNTKKGVNLSGSIAANPMAKYSDLAWSDAACNENSGVYNLTLSSQKASNYMTAGELNLMSRFSLNSSLTLNTAATDSDTSSSSATNNSSSSLSLSPSIERDTGKKFNNSQSNIIKPSHQTSNHLLQLQKEIKEEEEQIFADINSLIASNLYSTLVSTDDDDDDDCVDDGVNLEEESQCSPYNTRTLATHRNNNNNSRLQDFHQRTIGEIHYNNSSDDLNDYQSHSADDANNFHFQNDSISTSDERLKPHLNLHRSHQNQRYDQEDIHETEPTSDYMQHDVSQYSNDGDDHHHHRAVNDCENEASYYDEEQVFAVACEQGADQQDYQALQAVIQQVTSNLPKPCVFFLEGNCRRSDCKYSHDLSNITCKYWIEGFCFKGEMCPFLHSYNAPSDSGLLDEDGLKPMHKKELNPTFVIESEADFPSLPLDAPTAAPNEALRDEINPDLIATSIKNQILSSNPAVVFKTVKKKRKKG